MSWVFIGTLLNWHDWWWIAHVSDSVPKSDLKPPIGHVVGFPKVTSPHPQQGHSVRYERIASQLRAKTNPLFGLDRANSLLHTYIGTRSILEAHYLMILGILVSMYWFTWCCNHACVSHVTKS